MKVAIISRPRTGSTKLTEIISKALELKNYKEIFYEKYSEQIKPITIKLRILEDLKNDDNFIVKIHPKHISDIKVDLLNWDSYDLIIATNRSNKIDEYISHQYGFQRNFWINYPGSNQYVGEFTLVPKMSIGAWYSTVALHEQLLKEITNIIGREIVQIGYEIISDDEKLRLVLAEIGILTSLKTFDITFTPIGINYKEKCLNYEDIARQFKEIGYE
jgi:hypothetical protein